MPFIYLLVLIFILSGLVSQRQASNQRNWKPDAAKQAYGIIEGDNLTLHHVRNARYPAPGEPYEISWETRHYDLSKLKRLWFLVESFSDLNVIAHTFISFEFSDGEFLAVSVEAKPEFNESYSIVKGLLRHFELSYQFGDERDFIARRTLYQKHEVYLYPLITPPHEIRSTLERMVETANSLRETPRFYNSITDNCTSVLRKHANEVRPGSFGAFAIAQVLPGLSGQMLYKKGWIDTDVTLESLRRAYAIKERAETCGVNADFSSCIRAQLPEKL